MFEIIPKGLYIDFMARRHLFANVSWLLVALSLVAYFAIGPNWGIDFTGGTEVEVAFKTETSADEVRKALARLGVSDDAIQEVEAEEGSHFIVRTAGESAATPEDEAAVRDALVRAFGEGFLGPDAVHRDEQVGTRLTIEHGGAARTEEELAAALATVKGAAVQLSPEPNTFYVRLPGLAEGIRQALDADLKGRGVDILRTDTVGPKVGDSLRLSGALSLLITMAILLVFIGFRFDFTFAPGAILCLFHDTVIVIGVWVVLGEEFGLTVVSALLTLLGYSLNDTIVVYDRIRENLDRYRSDDFPQLINDSINQTFSRTLITATGTVMSMVPFLFLGGPILHQFALAMLIGIGIGTYSSIFVAAPMTLVLRENRAFFAGLLRGRSASSAGNPRP